MSYTANEVMSLNEQAMFEMASLGVKRTGVPLVIFVSPRMGQHGARIKIGNTPSDLRSGNTLSIIISDTPEVVSGSLKVDKSVLDMTKRWIVKNKDALLRYWSDDTMLTDDLFDLIQRI